MFLISLVCPKYITPGMVSLSGYMPPKPVFCTSGETLWGSGCVGLIVSDFDTRNSQVLVDGGAMVRIKNGYFSRNTIVDQDNSSGFRIEALMEVHGTYRESAEALLVLDNVYIEGNDAFHDVMTYNSQGGFAQVYSSLPLQDVYNIRGSGEGEVIPAEPLDTFPEDRNLGLDVFYNSVQSDHYVRLFPVYSCLLPLSHNVG